MINLNLKFYKNIYLVGGAVRDFLLNREIKDYDFVCVCEENDFKHIAFKFFKKNFNITPFLIGKAFPPTYRANFKGKIIDLTLIEKNIEYDAKRRDFTINAIYFDLNKRKIIDPLNGISDLERKKIRICSDKSFIIDPLRILRAFRFFSELEGFKIDYKTFDFIIKQKSLIKDTARERIKEELDKIILSKKIFITFNLLRKFEIFDPIFKNINWNNLKLLKKISSYLTDFEKKIFVYTLIFGTEIKEIKPSNREFKAVKEILSNYKKLLNLKSEDEIINFIYFHRNYFELIFNFCATFYNVKNYDKIKRFYKDFKYKEKELFSFVNGNDLIKAGLKEGKQVGEALDKIRLLYLKGVIKTKEEALSFIEKSLLS